MRPPSRGGTGIRLNRLTMTAVWPSATSSGCRSETPAPSTAHAATEPTMGPAMATVASTGAPAAAAGAGRPRAGSPRRGPCGPARRAPSRRRAETERTRNPPRLPDHDAEEDEVHDPEPRVHDEGEGVDADGHQRQAPRIA